jgi:hypothetical protein
MALLLRRESDSHFLLVAQLKEAENCSRLTANNQSILKSHNTFLLHNESEISLVSYGERVYFSSRLFPAFKPKCLKFNAALEVQTKQIKKAISEEVAGASNNKKVSSRRLCADFGALLVSPATSKS